MNYDKRLSKNILVHCLPFRKSDAKLRQKKQPGNFWLLNLLLFQWEYNGCSFIVQNQYNRLQWFVSKIGIKVIDRVVAHHWQIFM